MVKTFYVVRTCVLTICICILYTGIYNKICSNQIKPSHKVSSFHIATEKINFENPLKYNRLHCGKSFLSFVLLTSFLFDPGDVMAARTRSSLVGEHCLELIEPAVVGSQIYQWCIMLLFIRCF